MIITNSGQATARSGEGSTGGGPPPTLDVLLVTPLFPPDYSGAATRFQRYAPGLLDRGVRLRVLAAEAGRWRSAAKYREGSAPEVANVTGSDLPVRRVPVPRDASAAGVRRAFEKAVLNTCREPASRPDLVLSLALFSAVTALRFQALSVPLIHVQTMFTAPKPRSWTRWLREISFRIRHAAPDRIVVSSSVMGEDLRRRGVTTPSVVIPHGVDLTRFCPTEGSPRHAPARKLLGLAAEDEMILFVGSLHERKGVDLLAHAWERISTRRPQAHLVLVGPRGGNAIRNGSAFEERVRGRLERGIHAGRVHLVGPVRNVEAYLQAADVFVLPSRREGMPNVVCEAFACGVPTVLTPFLGLPTEFGMPGREYILVEHDEGKLASEVGHLLEDAGRRSRIGAAARRWAECELDVENSLDRYALLCRQLSGAR